MTTVAIIWYAALVALIGGILGSADRTLSGPNAGIILALLLTAGCALAAAQF